MKTRSAYIKAPWQCELREVELPLGPNDTPPPGHVLVRVEACGVCGSDLTAIAEKATDWRPVGHEIAGVVAKVGEKTGQGVKGLEVGRKVVLESSSFCGRCELCRDGRVDLCRKAPGFGSQPAMGMGMGDLLLAPVECVVPYEGLTPELACMTEPAGVAYDMVRTARIRLGDRVCVVGPGMIGLAAAGLALRGGASRVLCIGKTANRKRLELAADLGAETLATDRSLAEIQDVQGRFDHVLMTAPTRFIVPAMSLLAYGGEMTYVGIGTGDATISFDANEFHFRKLQLRASYAVPAIYFPAVLRLLRAGAIPGEKLVSHVIPLSDVQEAFRLCREEKQDTVKVVVRP